MKIPIPFAESIGKTIKDIAISHNDMALITLYTDDTYSVVQSVSRGFDEGDTLEDVCSDVTYLDRDIVDRFELATNEEIHAIIEFREAKRKEERIKQEHAHYLELQKIFAPGWEERLKAQFKKHDLGKAVTDEDTM